jgi:hypothetical protein
MPGKAVVLQAAIDLTRLLAALPGGRCKGLFLFRLRGPAH